VLPQNEPLKNPNRSSSRGKEHSRSYLALEIPRNLGHDCEHTEAHEPAYGAGQHPPTSPGKVPSQDKPLRDPDRKPDEGPERHFIFRPAAHYGTHEHRHGGG
jgi:hypothetical protein